MLRVTKKKDAGSVIFDVEQVAARGRDIEAWQFVVTDDAGRLGVPKIVNSGMVLTPTSNSESIRTVDWERLVNACAHELGDAKSLSKNKLEKELKSTCKFGTTKIRAFINKAIELGVLIERPGGTWGFSQEKSTDILDQLKEGGDPTLPF